MAQEFLFRQWPVIVQRKAGRRSLSISLTPDQKIIVKASLSLKSAEILKFLEMKSNWIEKNMLRFSEISKKYPSKSLRQGEKFPFMGQELELRIVPTPLKAVFFSRTELFLQIHLPVSIWKTLSEEELQKYYLQLKDYYKKEAQKLITERIQIWSFQTGLHPKQVRFKNQNTRWGSCSANKVININWRLIAAPLDILDYVLVHELCHLQYMNHSDDFWNLVEKNFPDYKKSEKWLNQNHHSLDFLKGK